MFLRRLTLAAALATVPACATNPATGERQFMLVSESQEIAMGREYDPQIVATFGLVEDQGIQSYVQGLGQRMAALSERPNLPWTFRVLDDPVINAFALPGGFIYITRGIMAHFGSEAELAAVLGHEIGHVTARHSAAQMSTQQLAQIGLVAGMIIKPELQQFAGLASAGLGLLFLKHSRDDERQADDLGLRYMRRANYDPREMPDVFTMLERASAASGRDGPPEWLSTHPNPENRRERILQQLPADPARYTGMIVNRDTYLPRLQGLVFGDNPRQGFFRDAEFLHPDLRFRVTFPSGWANANRRNEVLAVSPQEDAVVQLTLAAEATADLAARQFYQQEGVSGRHLPQSVNGLTAEVGTFRVTRQDGVLEGAVAFIGYDGRVFRVIGYSGTAQWPQYEPTVQRAIGSFRQLTDQAALGVQPARLSVARLDRPATVSTLAAQSSVDAGTLALLNQTSADATITAGSWFKQVQGGRLP